MWRILSMLETGESIGNTKGTPRFFRPPSTTSDNISAMQRR
jgi:hypothetical protein